MSLEPELVEEPHQLRARRPRCRRPGSGGRPGPPRACARWPRSSRRAPRRAGRRRGASSSGCEPLLEHRAGVGRQASPADVEGVARVREEGDHRPSRKTGVATVMSFSWDAVFQGSLVTSTSPGRSVSIGEAGRGSGACPVAIELMWPGVPVTAWATMRPRAVEDAGGEVAGLADDRRERGAHERGGLLVDRRDQPVPEDVEGDLLHRAPRARSEPAASPRSRSSASSTRICAAAVTTTVDSRSSMIAGPSSAAPAPSA